MSNLTDKQLLRELKIRLEERKKFDDEMKELSKDFQTVTKKAERIGSLKEPFYLKYFK